MDAVIPGLIGAVIGAIGGLTIAWSSSRWEDRRLRRTLAVERYRDGRDLLYELVNLAGRRHFALQRWLWALEDPGSCQTSEIREKYFDLLPLWNERTWGYRARLHLLLGDNVALRFLDYADDHRSEPESLHYMFVRAHDAVLAAESRQEVDPQAQVIVDQLNHAWSDFADDVTADLLRRAGDLRLLDPPKDL